MQAIEIATARSVVIAHLVVSCLSLGWLAGCTAKSDDAKSDEVATATELVPGKTAASLQLAAVAEQLEGNEIADVVALEAKINDPEAGLSAVDIDEDGVIDFVQVVEERKGDKTVLVLQAIPSSKKGEDVSKIAVEVARIELEVKDAEVKTEDADKTIVVHATYTEHIHHDPEIHIYHHEVPVVVAHGTLVVAEGCFFHHVFVVEHDLYHGHHGDVVIEVHHDDHHEHKHHKHKGHGKGHGHGNDHGGVVITW